MLDMIKKGDVFGFVRPLVDIHSLGISSITNLLESCGFDSIISETQISYIVENIYSHGNINRFRNWLIKNRVSHLGFSYRLDPKEGQLAFGRMFYQLKKNKLLIEDGGFIKKVLFAGLPETCKRVKAEHGNRIITFYGDENPQETLIKIGIPKQLIPTELTQGTLYDKARNDFADEIIKGQEYKAFSPVNRSGYNGYATFGDSIVSRINHSVINNLLPITRAHVGPYSPNHKEVLNEFKSWLTKLSLTGYLDVVSIGTSQLSQSNFGEDWGDKPNGGGVPINSIEDFQDLWKVSRPMLLRTYAGTKNIIKLAKIYEENIDIAWHALSFWWFCKIDGRGTNDVKSNLLEHYETLKYIAKTNKPIEPNIPHHFAFRGADDVSYVLSAVLAANMVKASGCKYHIQQVMLNTPKSTWGIQDIAKARAILFFIKKLEDLNFKTFLQVRAGLDYFSPNLEKAKKQLSSVSALMDDIDPFNQNSPNIIHVVSYSEAIQLATPEIIDESIKITQYSIQKYRQLRKKGLIDNINNNTEVDLRTNELIYQVKKLIAYIESTIKRPYSPEGLFKIFNNGILPVPYLNYCRNDFPKAINWTTRLIEGGIKLVDDNKKSLKVEDRIEILKSINNGN